MNIIYKPTPSDNVLEVIDGDTMESVGVVRRQGGFYYATAPSGEGNGPYVTRLQAAIDLIEGK